MPADSRPSTLQSPLARAAVVACCLLAGAVVVHSVGRDEPAAPRRPLAQLPMRIGDWQGQPGPALDRDAVTLLGASEFVNRVYASPAAPPLALYVGYYATQREGDTMHSPLNCLPGAGWQVVSRSRVAVPVGDVRSAGSDDASVGSAFRRISIARVAVVNRLIVQKELERDLVLYWYESHGRIVANEYWGRLLLAYDALTLNRTDGALVRLVVPLGDGDGEARSDAAAAGFVRRLVPLLDSYVPK